MFGTCLGRDLKSELVDTNRRKIIKIYIGWDSREDIAYQVCKHSILRRQQNVDITPLKQSELKQHGLYTRNNDNLSSTEFTFTRFLIPELMNYEGWALFIDCDTILTTDIKELFDQTNDQYAIMCVKHDYTPKLKMKMDGIMQTDYPRKNWSSVMLINCSHPSNKKLTSKLVNDQKTTGKYLHRFGWLDDNEIGSLNHTWNYLVEVYDDIEIPKLIHYTNGGPWFEKYRFCKLSGLWKNELYDMMNWPIINTNITG